MLARSLLDSREPADRRHGDRQPGRPVACLVDDLVDGLVGLERPQQRRRRRAGRGRRRGVAVAERAPVAVGPLGGAVRALRRRRGGRAAGGGRRSRRTAACRRRPGAGSRGRAAPSSGRAGSPSKSRSFQPSRVRSTWPRWRSPWTRCTGTAPSRAARSSNAARSSVGVRRRARAPRRPPGRAGRACPRRVRRAPCARASPVPKRVGQRGVHLGGRRAEPCRLAGEVAADLVGVQVGLGEEVAHAGLGQLPAVGGVAQEHLRDRQARRHRPVRRARPAALEPARAGARCACCRPRPGPRGSRCPG